MGTVVDDATGTGLPEATVAIYNGDGGFVTGTITDAEGVFLLERVAPGTYRVRASFIGYRSREIEGVDVRPGPPVDLGMIRLEEDVSLLGEAQVEAERELVEQRADRTVYNVAAQPVTAGGSVIETLQTLPSLEVDTEGNLSLRGNQNVVVHINGRPVPVRGAMLAAMLRQIPASNVERVEVIPNPSARYEPDGMSGIINIVLKEGTNRGLSGGLTVGGGSAPGAEASGNVAYQKGKVDAYASYGFRYDTFELFGTSLQTRFLTGGTEFTDQELNLDNGTGSHLFTGTLDYTLAQGTTVGFSGTFGRRAGPRDQAVFYRFQPDVAGWNTERLTEGEVDGLNGDAALNFRRQLDDAGHELTGEARYTVHGEDRDEEFTDLLHLPVGAPAFARSSTSENMYEQSLKVDYVRPLGQFRVEAGSKVTMRDLDSERDYLRQQGGAMVPVPGRSTLGEYQEDVYAGYVQASRAFGSFEAQAGVRAEAATRDLQLPLIDEDFSDEYYSLYPSAYLIYNFGPGTLAKAGFSRRVNRPHARTLNPTPQYDDTLIVDVGNPHLQPEYTSAYELTLQYKYFVTLTPFYRHTTDVIRRRVLFDMDTGISTVTFQNLDTQDTYGADLTLATRLGPLRGFISGSAYRSVTDGGSVETGLASDGFAWSVRGNLQAQIRKGTDVQLFGFYRAPLEVEDGRISGFGFTSLGVSQQLLGEKLRLAVRMNDVLGTARFEFDTGNADYHFLGIREPSIRQVSATLTYTFGQSAPRRPRPQETQQQPGLDGGIGF